MNMCTITCAHAHKSIGKRERERERKNQERNRGWDILLNTTIISGHGESTKDYTSCFHSRAYVT